MTPTPGTPDPGDGIGSGPDLLGLPLTGRANYSGQLALALERAGNPAGLRDTVTSPLSVAVDFGSANAQVTGAARDFPGFDGAVFLTLGAIDRGIDGTGTTFDGTLSGTIKENTQSYLVFGTFDGGFSGAGQEAVSGAVAGNVLNNNRQTVLTGSFQAGRVD